MVAVAASAIKRHECCESHGCFTADDAETVET